MTEANGDDTRVMAVYWIELPILLVVAIAWCVNVTKHKKIRQIMHKIITVVVWVMAAMSGTAAILYSLSRIFNNNSLDVASIVCGGVRTVALLGLAIALSTGVSIIFYELSRPKIFVAAVVSVLYGFCLCGCEFLGDDVGNVWQIVGSVVLVCMFTAYSVTFGVFAATVLKALRCHEQMIRERNIDPETVPTRKKYHMYVILVSMAGIMVLLYTIIGFVCIFGAMKYWQIKVFDAVLDAIFAISILIDFRVRNSLSAAYGDDEDAYRADGPEAEPWNDKMVLPEVPQLQRKERRIGEDL